MRIIVLPDVHGRRFWESSRERIDDCDKVVFLGDYFDPYGFEGISVIDAIKNFHDILSFVKDYPEKVVMLLGNHDLPYFSEQYRALADYHCRWSPEWHSVIADLFDANRELFKLAHVEGDVLFTHAGCVSRWLESIHVEPASLGELVTSLNSLLCDEKGMRRLYMVSRHRGGWDKAGSCVWADVNELVGDLNGLHFDDCPEVKQVFGHTLQVDYDEIGNLVSGEAIETPAFKMLDTRCAYLLDTATFTATPLPPARIDT